MTIEIEIRAVMLSDSGIESVPLEHVDSLDRVDTIGVYYRGEDGLQYLMEEVDPERFHELVTKAVEDRPFSI